MYSYLVGTYDANHEHSDEGVPVTAMDADEALAGARGLSLPADHPHGYWAELVEE